MSRPTAALVSALCAAAMLLSAPAFSGATFTSRSTSAIGTVTAAPDWTAPAVALRNPGSPVKDTVTLTADATDVDSGIASVTIQYLPENGTSWVSLCTATTAPYSCSWNTKSLADGGYDLRATANDNAGYSADSTVLRVTVANNLLVVLGRPADVVRGTVALTTSLFNAGAPTYKVDVQYAPTGTTAWRSISGCSALSAPYACSWATAGLPNQYYDLRAVAVAGSSTTTSATVADVLVDNTAPTLSMQDPGSPLGGTVTFAAVANDTDSGIASVVLQYAPTGTSTWKNLCTVAATPYSCRFDTTQLADGSYSLRAVATDVAGNSATSTTVGNRLVDNTVPTVSLDDPGAYLSGTVTLGATATATAGVVSVRIQRAPSGSGTWTDVCTDTAAPFTCAWSTTTVPNGPYDLRAVLLDGAGRTTTSATVAGRVVDNRPLRGYDVQSANGPGTAGKLDSGDVLRLTFTDRVNLSTITPAWSGSALAVTLRLRDGNLSGLGNKGDTIDVLRSGNPVLLGSVRLNEDYIKNNQTAQFNATMTASSTTVNGTPATVITLTLGSLASGGALRTAVTGSTMVWTPSASVTDLFGNPCSAAPTNEVGALDREF